ncbi:unnamed protein product [marine sediment metagenome]|uniref:DUF169 domain-containing protein n=1 Tax=marine sediment metagenome TaxID=412755 RepID=X1T8L3_9ZZZZ
MELNILYEYGDKIETFLKLNTFVLAIKLLKNKKEIPLDTKRPKKDFGYHLSLCQAFAISRREGRSLAILKEDMWCFEPVIGLGLAKASPYFLQGHNRFPGTARTLEAGKNWAQSLPHFEWGKYEGIAFSPLSKTTFDPDLIILYCNSTQLTQILIAINWIDGNDINCRLSGHTGCVYSIVPVIQNNQFQVSIPCIGDRKRAMAQNDELIFSSPIKKVKDLVTGLEVLAKNNEGLPVKFQQMPEYKLEKSYAKKGKLIGMDID